MTRKTADGVEMTLGMRLYDGYGHFVHLVNEAVLAIEGSSPFWASPLAALERRRAELVAGHVRALRILDERIARERGLFPAVRASYRVRVIGCERRPIQAKGYTVDRLRVEVEVIEVERTEATPAHVRAVTVGERMSFTFNFALDQGLCDDEKWARAPIPLFEWAGGADQPLAGRVYRLETAPIEAGAGGAKYDAVATSRSWTLLEDPRAVGKETRS